MNTETEIISDPKLAIDLARVSQHPHQGFTVAVPEKRRPWVKHYKGEFTTRRAAGLYLNSLKEKAGQE
jgi:hypothetical protein